MTVGVDLDHMTGVVFVRFLYCKITNNRPSLFTYSLEQSHWVQTRLKESGLMLPPSLRAEYLHNCLEFFYTGYLPLLPELLIYLIIYLDKYGLINIHF